MRTIYVIELYLVLSTAFPSLRLSAMYNILLGTSTLEAPRIRITPMFLFGSFLVYSGTALRAWCFRTLGRHFTFHLAILKDHKLITDGPYSIVRHPSYTGSILFCCGLIITQVGSGSWMGEYVACWDSSLLNDGYICQWGLVGKSMGFVWALMNVFVPYVLLSRMAKEDEVLKREFGKEWVEWAKRTPYRLFPHVY